MGPDTPLRLQIKTEWRNNKGEVGGPFRLNQSTFTTHTLTHTRVSFTINEVTRVIGCSWGHIVACQSRFKVKSVNVYV